MICGQFGALEHCAVVMDNVNGVGGESGNASQLTALRDGQKGCVECCVGEDMGDECAGDVR